MAKKVIKDKKKQTRHPIFHSIIIEKRLPKLSISRLSRSVQNESLLNLPTNHTTVAYRMKFNLFLSIILKILSTNDCIEKYWQGKLDWNDPLNWKNGLVPKKNSYLVFPLEMRHSVGMPKSMDIIITGIELSNNGEIALPLDGDITVSIKIIIVTIFYSI